MACFTRGDSEVGTTPVEPRPSELALPRSLLMSSRRLPMLIPAPMRTVGVPATSCSPLLVGCSSQCSGLIPREWRVGAPEEPDFPDDCEYPLRNWLKS